MGSINKDCNFRALLRSVGYRSDLLVKYFEDLSGQYLTHLAALSDYTVAFADLQIFGGRIESPYLV